MPISTYECLRKSPSSSSLVREGLCASELGVSVSGRRRNKRQGTKNKNDVLEVITQLFFSEAARSRPCFCLLSFSLVGTNVVWGKKEKEKKTS